MRTGRQGPNSPFGQSPEFLRLLAGDLDPDLARIALEIAGDAYPALDADAYLGKLDALAERVRGRCTSLEKPRLVLGQINWVLFVEEGFRGNVDHYDDPRNSYLNEVLDRKTGIPITLSVVYWRVARRLGLEVGGLNLPAHFMLRVASDQGPILVDPFHSGALLDREGCRRQIAQQFGRPVHIDEALFQPCPIPQVVARMLRNLKSLYLQRHDYAAAVPVLHRLAALDADGPEGHRDLGLLLIRLDRRAEAIAPLQHYLETRPDSPDASDVLALLRAARRDIALRN